jgi:hypothetical protein
MEPFEVFKVYLALKLHFTTKAYDITQTKGAVRAKKETFLKRKDLTSIRKLARDFKRSEIIDILVANFVSGDKWGGIFDAELLETHKKWLTTKKKMLYNFDTDLDNILLRMEKNDLQSVLYDGTHPLIFKMFMGRDINLETLVMIEKLRPYTDLYYDDFVLEETCLLVKKYKPFVRFDKEAIESKYKDKLNIISGNEKT